MKTVTTGLENFLENPPASLSGQRIGLLCNEASVDRRFRHASRLIDERFPNQLRALFAPQHGFFSEKQDNMVESDDMIHPELNIPVHSLYGRFRRPQKKMFDDIDVLVVDLQDVGTRVYTFVYTMSYCLEAARSFAKRVIVCDRPNPLGGAILEGGCLHPDWASFVGRYPIPMRHGLTIGELANLFNEEFDIGCDLDVVPMKHWRRNQFYEDTDLPWVPPSPNLPTPTSALVYPGQVIWEGTNISEGRGTTRPFEMFGAPFVEPTKLRAHMDDAVFSGTVLRPTLFEPTAHKWAGKACKGFHIHVTDPHTYRPYTASLAVLQGIIKLYPEQFEWKPPPYEYENHRMPIDLIIGDGRVRKRIAALESLEALAKEWQPAIDRFQVVSRKHYLYEKP